jgi:Sugar (and other) transporter
MGIATLMNWTSNFAVGLFWPMISASLGSYSWLPFSAVLLITFIGIWSYVVETRDKSLEDIQVTCLSLRPTSIAYLLE